MHITAYVLAADPTWIERSVLSYYDHVSEIVVSFDADHRGWSGAPTDAHDAIERLRRIDHERKCRYVSGSFARPGKDPLESDTIQRQAAFTEAAHEGVEWVLQIDTDEVLTDAVSLVESLAKVPDDCDSVEWPMHVLYRRRRANNYLQVVDETGEPVTEFPGPVAARPTATLRESRRTSGIAHRFEDVPPIIHNSWARTPRRTFQKVRTSGHNDGLKLWIYYFAVWLPAPLRWRRMRDFHPLIGPVWPRLAPVRLDAPRSTSR